MIACTCETGWQWRRRCQVWKSFPSTLAPAESNQRICGNRPSFQAWYLSRVQSLRFFFFDEIHSLRLFYAHATLQLCVRTNSAYVCWRRTPTCVGCVNLCMQHRAVNVRTYACRSLALNSFVLWVVVALLHMMHYKENE
jgi:hypothetical protein